MITERYTDANGNVVTRKVRDVTLKQERKPKQPARPRIPLDGREIVPTALGPSGAPIDARTPQKARIGDGRRARKVVRPAFVRYWRKNGVAWGVTAGRPAQRSNQGNDKPIPYGGSLWFNDGSGWRLFQAPTRDRSKPSKPTTADAIRNANPRLFG